jgi:hypothetical protein
MAHPASPTSDNDRIYACQHCPKRYARKDYLERHELNRKYSGYPRQSWVVGAGQGEGARYGMGLWGGRKSADGPDPTPDRCPALASPTLARLARGTDHTDILYSPTPLCLHALIILASPTPDMAAGHALGSWHMDITAPPCMLYVAPQELDHGR